MKGQQFRAQLGAWAQQTQANLDALVRQSTQELAARVVQATPVDTGFLRGSWQPSIGEPKVAQGTFDKAGAIAMGMVGVAAAGMKAGDYFYMLNNASYAEHVEYGTSKMAGRHFVGNTVLAWAQIVDETAADLGLKK